MTITTNWQEHILAMQNCLQALEHKVPLRPETDPSQMSGRILAMKSQALMVQSQAKHRDNTKIYANATLLVAALEQLDEHVQTSNISAAQQTVRELNQHVGAIGVIPDLFADPRQKPF